MKREITHGQDLETAAKSLLAATRLTTSEIDKIASAPHLFGSIRIRIAEQTFSKEAAVGRPAFAWLGIKAIAVAGVVVTVMAAAFFTFRRDVPRPRAVVSNATQPRPPMEKFDPPKQDAAIIRSREPDREVGRPILEHASENAIVKEYVRRRQARKDRSNKAGPDEELDFYALNASAWETRDGRIVRVTLPRASLVALGANISLEGEKQNVTADLLVGADGVPRAIRVVE